VVIASYPMRLRWRIGSTVLLVLLAAPALVPPAVWGGPPDGIWWMAALAMLICGGYAVRALRSGVTITDQWIERRGVLSSWRLPWASVDEVRADDAWFAVAAGERCHVSRRPPGRRRRLAFECALRRGWRRPIAWPAILPPPPGVWYGYPPAPYRMNVRDVVPWAARWVAVMLAILWFGALLVVFGATSGRSYEARAARDLATSAKVVDWSVEHDEVTGLATTTMLLRFHPADADAVDVQLEVDGPEPMSHDRIAILYDPEHPNDVDFGDGRTWRGQEQGARDQQSAGWMLVSGSVLGLLYTAAVGTSIWRSWWTGPAALPATANAERLRAIAAGVPAPAGAGGSRRSAPG
jgi:hypothetical protein